MIICDLSAVDPYAMNAQGIGMQTCRAAGQIMDTPLCTSADAMRIKQKQIGRVGFAQQSARRHAEDRSTLGRELVGGLFKTHHAKVAHPMSQ